MFSQLEALLALVRHGTMSAAALSLRVSQSAVSKRIAQLEARLGKRLVRREGRRSVLTPDGDALVEDVMPLMADLTTVLSQRQADARHELAIAVSEAVLSSWGAAVLVQLRSALPDRALLIHTHRSPTIVEKVQSGHYPFGLCAGVLPHGSGLVTERLLDEPMVLLAQSGDLHRLQEDRAGQRVLPVVCIEKSSNTWRGIQPRAEELGLEPRWPVESSFAAARLALAGWGHALVPMGVAQALQAEAACIDLGPHGLTRPATLVCRKQRYHQEDSQALLQALNALIRENAAAGVAG